MKLTAALRPQLIGNPLGGIDNSVEASIKMRSWLALTNTPVGGASEITS